MRKSRYSVSQIIAISKQSEADIIFLPFSTTLEKKSLVIKRATAGVS
jgi:hypothetical protein